jgi:hypothetical protein
MVYTPSSTVLGQSPIVPAVAVATTSVYLHSYIAATSGSEATTASHASRVPVLQLREGWEICQGLPTAETGQFATYSSTCGEPVEEPVEKRNTMIWPCQLHHYGGDTHGRGSTCGYILPQ